jgi:hypothetical protein
MSKSNEQQQTTHPAKKYKQIADNSLHIIASHHALRVRKHVISHERTVSELCGGENIGLVTHDCSGCSLWKTREMRDDAGWARLGMAQGEMLVGVT